MKLTKNVISRAEAMQISPEFVAWSDGDFNAFTEVCKAFQNLKRGDAVLACVDGTFVRAKVTKCEESWQALDGPLVRVSNGEYSWRVDGDGYAFPIKRN